MKGILADGGFSWKWCIIALDLFNELQCWVVLFETKLITLDVCYFHSVNINEHQIVHVYPHLSTFCYIFKLIWRKVDLDIDCSMFSLISHLSLHGFFKVYKVSVSATRHLDNVNGIRVGPYLNQHIFEFNFCTSYLSNLYKYALKGLRQQANAI